MLSYIYKKKDLYREMRFWPYRTALTAAYVNISREGPLLAPHLPHGFLDLEGEIIGLLCSPGM